MAEVVSLRAAVSELVPDGAVVALEGFSHLVPFAAGHEILRQRRLPFLISTGLGQGSMPAGLGAAAILSKPFSADSLAAAVAQLRLDPK